LRTQGKIWEKFVFFPNVPIFFSLNIFFGEKYKITQNFIKIFPSAIIMKVVMDASQNVFVV